MISSSPVEHVFFFGLYIYTQLVNQIKDNFLVKGSQLDYFGFIKLQIAKSNYTYFVFRELLIG